MLVQVNALAVPIYGGSRLGGEEGCNEGKTFYGV